MERTKLSVQNAMDFKSLLIIAKKELAIEHREKKKREAELLITKEKLDFATNEKKNRAAELIIVKKEVETEYKEKTKRSAELLIANKKLEFENIEKENRAAELTIANKELKFQNIERDKRAVELFNSNNELKRAEASQKEYINGLKEMMFMTSHELRQPIVQILGLASILDTSSNTLEELDEIVAYIKKSAESLDLITRQLTVFIHDQNLKAENKMNQD
jgi:signal transduction histidine kinase